MSAENTRALHELRRIRWRGEILARPGGADYLVSLLKMKLKEKDLGPHAEKAYPLLHVPHE